MKIKRFDIGFWRKPSGRIAWTWPPFEYHNGICGCVLITIGPICITWIGDECLDAETKQ